MKNFYKGLVLVGSLALASCGQSDGYGTTGSGGNGGASSVTCNPCRIFSTNSTSQGNFGSADAADAVCAADSNKPNSSTYRAIVVAPDRSINSATWPIKSGVTYVRADGSTTISTGDSSGFLTLPLTNSVITTSSTYHWSGIEIAGAPTMAPSTNNCNNWSSNSNSDDGATGTGSLTASYGWVGMNSTGRDCDQSYRFYCVEQ